MTKRKDLVRRLEQSGFCSQGGTKHEKFTHPDGRTVLVPRHREVPHTTAKAILRQAGLR